MVKDIFPVVKEAKAAPKPVKVQAKKQGAASVPTSKQTTAPPAPVEQVSAPVALPPQRKAVAPLEQPSAELLQKHEEALAEAVAETTAANLRTEEALQSLRESADREASLADLLATAGYSALSLNAIDWSVGDAKKLLEEEAAQVAKLDSMLSNVRAGSARCASMIAEQEKLQKQLSQFAPHVA